MIIREIDTRQNGKHETNTQIGLWIENIVFYSL